MSPSLQLDPPQTRPARWLVGRTRERVLLHEEFAATAAGHGRLVLLGGEAGMGKTTLARDLAQDAARRDAIVLTGHCYDLTTTSPYGPWLDFASAYSAYSAHRVNDGLPALPSAFIDGKLEGIANQSALFGEVLRFFRALATIRPTLVILEDLHWSDSTSLELLRYLTGKISSQRMLLLVTYRIDELTRQHPFYQQLPSLIRAGTGLRLDLHRLEPDDLRALTRAYGQLEPADENRLVDYLAAHSDGNPFFATELLRALGEQGVLRRDHDRWLLGSIDRVVVPSLLTQVIDSRIGRMGEATRKPLAMAAVIGQDVPLALWAEVAALDEDALLTIVEAAIEANVLDAERDGLSVRFVHALIREVLYESVSPPRRRTWHRLAGEAVAARPHPDPDAVAYHFQQAGDPRAPEWLTRAGERAQRAYAWVSAAQRLRAAATALEAVPGSERERGWLLYRAARMLRIADPVEGAATLEQVMRLADVSGDRVLAGESRYSHGLLRMYLNQCDAGIAELVAGIDELQALPIEEAFGDRSIAIWQADALPEQEGEADRDIEMGSLLLRTTGIHHRRTSLPWWYSSFGRPTTAIEIGDACVEKITPLADRSGLLRCGIGHAHHGLGMAHAMLGDAEASRDHFRHARDVYEGMNHHGIIAFSYLNELRDVACVYDADSPGRRRELASEAESALGRAGGALPEGFSTQLGTLSTLVCDGEWETVRAILRDTIRPINVYLQREYVDAALALAWWENDLELARRLIDSVLPGGPTEPPGSRHHSQAIFLQRMAAMIALEANDPSTATGWLDANERWLAWSGSVSGKSEHALLRSAFNRAQGNAAQARECAEQALRTAEEPRQPLALVAGHRVLGELASERGDFTLADRHLAASAAIADACEVPLEIGLTMASLARLRHAERRTGEANSLANEAMSIFDRLGATRALRLLDPPRVDRDPATATPPPFALTPRELEVLRLLADGLTDVAIGVRLFISPRTVSHHLRSVYAKIGVSSRSGATRFALERGLIHTPPA